MRRLHVLAILTLSLASLAPRPAAAGATTCTQPDRWSVAAAFDLAAAGLLPSPYPQLPANPTPLTIPPSVLKAVGWVESGWRQLTPAGRPLVSFDFGYGIMQITSGMAGAFGDPAGSIDPQLQSRIATDYVYNIAFGARMLATKWLATPRVGNGDPSDVEDWYYALWAYNGWGWVNNPNNPRFSRTGTPATDPSAFPYQERVLYLVAHPPHDADGNPLWQPIPVTFPSPTTIGKHPKALALSTVHQSSIPPLSAIYRAGTPPPLSAGAAHSLVVHVTNTGTQAWPVTGSLAVGLSYHVLDASANAWKPFSPFTPGVVAFGQGDVPLPSPVLPGQTAAVRVQVHAPLEPGSYRLVWDLQQGSSSWFSQAGILPRAVHLRVLASGVTVTSASSPAATPTPRPPQSLKYVADTSVPDGTVLTPGQSFLKGWLVQNCGRSSWTTGSTLRLVAGTSFGARFIPVPAAGACTSAVILAKLRAPRKIGSYTGAWQLRDRTGRTIGDRLTVVVQVRSGRLTGTPLPGTTPAPRPTRTPAAPTPTTTPVG